jgi:hypothetical protein
MILPIANSKDSQPARACSSGYASVYGCSGLSTIHARFQRGLELAIMQTSDLGHKDYVIFVLATGSA